jgi:DNA primase catalytic subunit
MSRLSNLIGKPKKVKIGDEEFELKPLTVRDMNLMADLADDSKRTNALKQLITKTLKQSIEGVTDEEVNNISMEYFEDLMLAVLEVNGVGSKRDIEKKLKEMKAASS